MKKKAYSPEWYPSPIKLAEATSGAMSIRHRIIKVGGEVRIIGMRQAILRGYAPVSGRVEKEPLVIHELVEKHDGGDGIWMTDLPEELNQIGEMLFHVNPKGRVLVGGLGLGIAAKTVAEWPGVAEVVVVERSPDVVKLCAHPDAYLTVESDIKDFLKTHGDPYDFFLLDTWAGTNEGTWWEDVMPLRRIIRNRWGARPRIHCWAEDIMRGQLHRTLTSTVPHWYYKHLPVPMSGAHAHAFIRNVGLPAWEKQYGAAVDKAFASTDD